MQQSMCVCVHVTFIPSKYCRVHNKGSGRRRRRLQATGLDAYRFMCIIYYYSWAGRRVITVIFVYYRYILVNISEKGKDWGGGVEDESQ